MGTEHGYDGDGLGCTKSEITFDDAAKNPVSGLAHAPIRLACPPPRSLLSSLTGIGGEVEDSRSCAAEQVNFTSLGALISSSPDLLALWQS